MKPLVCFLLISLSPWVLGFDELEKGSVSYTSRDLSDQDFIRFTAIARNISNLGLKGADLRHFIKIEGSTYALMKGESLVGYSVSGNALLGSWKLTRWPHDHYFPQELESRYIDHNYASDFDDDRPFHLELGREAMFSMGCFADTPLRYGDINDDGSSELVVWIGNDLVIFSTVKNKVIFSQRLRVEDWLDKNESEEFLSLRFGNLEPHFPQYQSAVLRQTTANYQSAALGYRGYGKLYMDDFNEDGRHDIVVWHKFYISNTRGDSTPGFTHERDTLLHYSLVDGEYQPQETEEDVIRGWLAENELTWQNGYPSKSECEGEGEGEEGELIPEMHDPLLNDPDVLK